jgi:G3E family GTPase
MLMEILTPLVTSQIQHADVIVISKTDLAKPGEVEFACRTSRELNLKARIVSTGVRGRLEPTLISELLPWLNGF